MKDAGGKYFLAIGLVCMQHNVTTFASCVIY